MSFASLALVVLAAFIHATWNLLTKRAAAAGPAFVVASGLVGCLAYLPWTAWLVAHGALPWSWPALACILLSAVIHLAYSLCLQRGYQVADLSVVYPIARGSGPMLSSLGAFFLLGEAPTGQGLLGLAAVVAGIGLIATQGDLSAFRRPGGQAGMRWGLTTGSLIAGYTVVDAYGVKTLGIHAVVLDWFSNLLRLVLLAPVVLADPTRARDRMRGHWLLAVLVGVLSPLSYILVLTALDWGAPLSVVAPTREMSMMVGALLGMVVLREPVGTWRLAGCAVLIGGVMLLGTS
ncbi:MAG TPA: DMT family transporter [Microvirga sp.]|jgi:drug/metabolite transporter (DMT)-like permease|nr:DMT family transporter [Microvirga sp.]